MLPSLINPAAWRHGFCTAIPVTPSRPTLHLFPPTTLKLLWDAAFINPAGASAAHRAFGALGRLAPPPDFFCRSSGSRFAPPRRLLFVFLAPLNALRAHNGASGSRTPKRPCGRRVLRSPLVAVLRTAPFPPCGSVFWLLQSNSQKPTPSHPASCLH